MSISYIMVAILLILINITKVPEMFSLIIKSAISIDAVFGGIVGTSISWGVRRGVFSNEAGLGTGAWVAGCADVSHPAKAGLSQTFSVFISLLICIATSLMILVTDSYNVIGADGNYIVQNIIGDYDIYVTHSIDSVVQGFGTIFITIAMFLFTFTTIMAYSLYLSRINYFFFSGYTDKKNVKIVSTLINIVTTVLAFLGPLVSSSTIWSMASAMCGLISLINLFSLILLYKPAIITLKDYEKQLKMGLDPVFIPEKYKIENAELWNKISGYITKAFAVGSILAFGKASVDAANESQSAWTGLNSIISGQNKSFSKAQSFINDYISDGLVPLNNAVTTYKNLLLGGEI